MSQFWIWMIVIAIFVPSPAKYIARGGRRAGIRAYAGISLLRGKPYLGVFKRIP